MTESLHNVNEWLCFSCGKKIVLTIPVQRGDECEHCQADVKVCFNCQFYDRGSYNECRESSADVVREKDRANFCDYFAMGNNTKTAPSPSADQLKAAAETLFKKNRAGKRKKLRNSNH